MTDDPAAADAAPPIEAAPAARPLTPDEELQELGRLIRRNRQIDAEKRQNNQRIDTLKERAKRTFEERQSRSTDLVGIGNLHLIKKTYAKVIRQDGDYTRDATTDEREAAADALRRAGLDRMLREQFNVNSVSSYIKELDEQGEHPPPELLDGFKIEYSYDIGLTT